MGTKPSCLSKVKDMGIWYEYVITYYYGATQLVTTTFV